MVPRLVAELEANPESRRLLLHALLPDEFLEMPARIDRMDQDITELKSDVKQLKVDVAELKVDVAELKVDVAELKVDVGHLKGDALEAKLFRWILPVISRALTLRRGRVMLGGYPGPDQTFMDLVESSEENGLITEQQLNRILMTDAIVRARRPNGGPEVWVAVEASNRVHAEDISRCLETADALRTLLGTETIAVVAGYSIDPRDQARASDAGVLCVEVTPSR